ncbi:MAG TPA: transglycosylase [Xanthobacteraceae bacterium]|nr:transglycosylase [Xanthobacteraceae bacterium]
MKEFWIASTVTVAVMIVSYPFMERPPQLVPRTNAPQANLPQANVSQADGSHQNTAQQTAESVAERPAEGVDENPVGKPVESVTEASGEPAADISQQQTADLPQHEQPAAFEQQKAAGVDVAIEDNYPDSMPLEPDLSYLADYAYSEVPPDTKPADTVLQALKEIPPGTALDEIDFAATAFGLDTGFMKAVARIESGFDPKQRTGSYIGLFQLSNYEFDKYGSGDITDARDNAVAAAYKFVTAAILFKISTHKKPSLSDLYLIHQQGTQGAAEHVSHPERIAWKSMCATDEGRVKGEKWCKRAIWQNTLPAVKAIWKSVDNLTSGAFVEMWHQRVDLFYARYSQALAQK